MNAIKRKSQLGAWLKRVLSRAPRRASEPGEVTGRPMQLAGLRPCSCGKRLSEGWACECNAHLIEPIHQDSQSL